MLTVRVQNRLADQRSCLSRWINAMGNHVACCGNGPVAEPEATAPPTQQEPLEEDQVILSPGARDITPKG